MINFDELEEVNYVDPDKHLINDKKNYIIGCDPFDQSDAPSSEYNVFYVFDKFNQRKVLRHITKKPFGWFVEFVKMNDIFKNNYVVSKKFINDNDRPKTREEIIRDYGFEGNIIAQQIT